jgi:hypothetical protein
MRSNRVNPRGGQLFPAWDHSTVRFSVSSIQDSSAVVIYSVLVRPTGLEPAHDLSESQVAYSILPTAGQRVLYPHTPKRVGRISVEPVLNFTLTNHLSKVGAAGENRTREIHVGNVTPYHLATTALVSPRSGSPDPANTRAQNKNWSTDEELNPAVLLGRQVNRHLLFRCQKNKNPGF